VGRLPEPRTTLATTRARPTKPASHQQPLTIDEDILNALLAQCRFARITRQLYLTALRRLLQWMDAHDLLDRFNRAKTRLKVVRGDARVGYRHRAVGPDWSQVIAYYNERSRRINIRCAGGWISCATARSWYTSVSRVGKVAALTRPQWACQ